MLFFVLLCGDPVRSPHLDFVPRLLSARCRCQLPRWDPGLREAHLTPALCFPNGPSRSRPEQETVGPDRSPTCKLPVGHWGFARLAISKKEVGLVIVGHFQTFVLHIVKQSQQF